MEVNPIAFVESIFKEKFGTPRQVGLCPKSHAAIVFENTTFNRQALENLDGFSHLWVIFYFHDLKNSVDQPKIRPPRLGGNKFVGVFSSRSPYRPNRLGLSLVQLVKIVEEGNKLKIFIANHDLIDGTPVLDIKPLISHDIPQVPLSFGWQSSEWQKLEISFSDEVERDLKSQPKLREIIFDVLQNDPRPAYKAEGDNTQTYNMNIDGNEIQFEVQQNRCSVLKISK